MAEKKTLDMVMRTAFLAGARFGARYPEVNSWPEWEVEAQFRAFKDDLQGNPWSPQDWFNARQEAQAKARAEKHPFYRSTPGAGY